MPTFKMVTEQSPAGDQAAAIGKLSEGIRRGDRYQTLLGVTGSGKSVVASTPVFLKQGQRIALESIGRVIDRLIDRASSRVRREADSEILDRSDLSEPIEAWSFDPRSGRASWKPVRQVLRHRSPETLWALSTVCGRSVTVTGDHNFFVLRGERLHLLRTEEIRPGDRVPLPRCLPGPQDPLSELSAAGPASLERWTGPEFPHSSPVAAARPAAARPGERVPLASGRYAAAVLPPPDADLTGGADARSKRLPSFWPQLSNAHLAQMLRAYFAADGEVDGGAVTCVVGSRALASDLCFALLRFGIVARMRAGAPGPARETPQRSWSVCVSGPSFLRRFHDAMGFPAGGTRTRLETALHRGEHTNAGFLPAGGGEVPGRCEAPGHTSEEMAGRMPSWTPVRSLERVPGEAYVYDLAVEENETFLAGWGGLFVHNTYTMARVIEQIERPTLILAHNKTLAAQLYGEFRQYFPENAVRYFVSYYDYYQPEAYVPQTDLYIAKDASINDEIDRLRHASTKALMERRDVIIVASVSCIYGLGSPQDYQDVMLFLRTGEVRSRDEILRRLVDVQYERNDIDFARGRFRVRGDVIEIFPAYEDRAVRVELFGDQVERILEVDPLTAEVLAVKPAVAIWPAKHWVTTDAKMAAALGRIEAELAERTQWFKDRGKLLEAQRLEFRTKYDLEMLREVGYCPGIENYSRHLSGRAEGERPGCLLDYFPADFLAMIDESHVTVPQVRGMHEGDRARKRNLIEFGFRLPSAYDNRPLTFAEFSGLVPQVVFVSATPSPFELGVSAQTVEQIVRPTGLVDPQVEVRPARGQVDDLIGEIKAQAAKSERTLVTTLTKRMAEDLTDYLQELGMKVHYLHSEVETLQRVQILKDLRLGTYDVLVGINLLREGLDLPEVSLVAILDADKEGYLRSETSLIQTMGRAARNLGGRVVLYADEVTESMRKAIHETNRRRAIQIQYNADHGITPHTIVKPIRDFIDLAAVAEEGAAYEPAEGAVLTAAELIGLAEHQHASVPWDIARLLMLSPGELERTVEALEREMRKAAGELQFEKAAVLRDQIQELRKGLGEPFFAGGRPARARGGRRGAAGSSRGGPRRNTSPRG
ncbi:MAG TPA: excinuclease ABC subunit UvrB [bacterium]|nr:excinuclease ABC subunit UvrB [bacterium]